MATKHRRTIFRQAYALSLAVANAEHDADILDALNEALWEAFTDGWVERETERDFIHARASGILEAANAPLKPEARGPIGNAYETSEGHDNGYATEEELWEVFDRNLSTDDLFFHDDVSRSERSLDEVEDFIAGTTRRYPDGPTR